MEDPQIEKLKQRVKELPQENRTLKYQAEAFQAKARKFSRYLNDLVFIHTTIAKKFHEEINKETFFHDGQVAKAVMISVDFKLLFAEELKGDF